MAMYPFNSKHSILLSTKSDLGGIIMIQPGKIIDKKSKKIIKNIGNNHSIYLIISICILLVLILFIIISIVI